MSLSAKDYKKILKIIDIIHSAPDPNTMFRGVCDELKDLIRIYSAVFAPIDPKTRRYYFTGYEVYNNCEASMALYLDHYGSLDPFITCNWYSNANKAGQNTELVPKHVFKKSEFASDFLLPIDIFHILAASLVSQGDKVGTCGFHRHKSENDFGKREKDILDAILPHMATSIRNMRMASETEYGKEPNGIILLAEDGQTLYINDAARQATRGVPPGSIPTPGSSPVFFKNGTRMFRVRTALRKDGGTRMVILEPYPPEHRLGSKLDGFGLSRREKEIAVSVIQGLSNREIAERLFICEQTVKDHLRSIFGKLEIKRRSELPATVLGLRTPE